MFHIYNLCLADLHCCVCCLLSLIFLLTILHKVSVGLRSGQFLGQSPTVTPWSSNQLLVSVGIFVKLVSWMLYSFSADSHLTWWKQIGPASTDKVAPQMLSDIKNIILDLWWLGFWGSLLLLYIHLNERKNLLPSQKTNPLYLAHVRLFCSCGYEILQTFDLHLNHLKVLSYFAPFSDIFCSATQLSGNVLGNRSLWTLIFYSNDFLFLLLTILVVDGGVNCQFSSESDCDSVGYHIIEVMNILLFFSFQKTNMGFS